MTNPTFRPQLHYQKFLALGRPGQVATNFSQLFIALTCWAASRIPFGRFVSYVATIPSGPDAHTPATASLTPVALPSASGDITGKGGMGVAQAIQSIEGQFDNNSAPGYPTGKPLSVVTKGPVVVETTVAVASNDPAYVEFTAASAADEVQVLTPSAVPTSGTFKLELNGAMSSALRYDADAAAIQAALVAMLGAGNVTVSGDWGSAFTVTFAGELTELPVMLLSVKENTLANGEATQNEIQTITPSAVPTEGEVAFGDGTTFMTPVAYNANAAAWTAAFEEVFGTGNVTVTGTLATLLTVEFIGELAGMAMPLIQEEAGSTLARKVAQVDTVTVSEQTDGSYTATINGTDFTFTASSNNKTEIRDGLVALINAGSEPVTAVPIDDATDDKFTLTADEAGTAFTLAVTANMADEANQENVDEEVSNTIETTQQGGAGGAVVVVPTESVRGTDGNGGTGLFTNNAEGGRAAALPNASFVTDAVYDRMSGKYLAVVMLNQK